jgi:hypothetical protein
MESIIDDIYAIMKELDDSANHVENTINSFYISLKNDDMIINTIKVNIIFNIILSII